RHTRTLTLRAWHSDLGHCAAHPLRRATRVGKPRTGQHDRELLAAVAGSKVELADGARQRLPDCADDFVTRLVAIAVVDSFEVVDVRDHERDARTVLVCARQLGV